MDSIPVLPSLRWPFAVWLLLLPCATAVNASSLVVQQIRDLSGATAEAVVRDGLGKVTIVPLSPDFDPRTTPIILAPGTAFVGRDGEGVGGLRPGERRAIQQAYDAGQVIMLLEASTHDIEALHLLLDDGVPHESSTDPVVLAYALRKENNIPTARLVTDPVEDDLDEDDLDEDDLDEDDLDEDDLDEDDLALSGALEIVIAELTRPPAASEIDDPAAGSTNWGSSPVQSIIITSTTNGTYNTPIELYALHSCHQNMDYYLVNTGGTWTATQARYESASARHGQIRANSSGDLFVNWQPHRTHCSGGAALLGRDNEYICRYMDYPQHYEVDIVPPSGPTVVQVNAAPAGDQGKSASYTSGFSFGIGGGVDVSGSGPSAGFQAGVTWDNSVSTTVPPLVVEAGNQGNQGTFTRYKYCTVGDRVQDCTSAIQMGGAEGLCREFVVGDPQNGQTPNGRLSNVAQTVNWQVDPGTYTGSTFDITVTFQVALATSTSYLWLASGPFENKPRDLNSGPIGYCNIFGCSCGIRTNGTAITVSHTFKMPLPSTQCSP
jgi:hypothetical protein